MACGCGLCLAGHSGRVLSKFYSALFNSDLDSAAELLSSHAHISVTGSPAKSVNGWYSGIKGFMKMQSNMLASYSQEEHDRIHDHYNVVSYEGDTAIGRITATRHYNTGEIYQVTASQTAKIDGQGKIDVLITRITSLKKADPRNEYYFKLYYSSYTYYYSEDEIEDVDPVIVVSKACAALQQRNDTALLDLVSEYVQVVSVGSPRTSLNHIYYGTQGFEQYLFRRNATYNETEAEYQVIGLVNSGGDDTKNGDDKSESQPGFKKVKAIITATRTYKNDAVYREKVYQTFFLGRTGKIVRLNSNVTYTNATKGKNATKGDGKSDADDDKSAGDGSKGDGDETGGENTVKTVTVSFEGDYTKVIGANKKKFLEQCSAFISKFSAKVTCADVRSGSILIDLQGRQADLQSAVSGVATKGLQLEGFPPLEVKGPLEL